MRNSKNKNCHKTSPFYFSVKRAPFKIGDKVKVLNNPNFDETFNPLFSFKLGLIIYFDYSCGCGQKFPDDPMIGIEFDDGLVEEFSKEEIKKID